MKIIKHLRVLVLAMAAIFLVAAMALASFTLPDGVVGIFERVDGGYFTLRDQDSGEAITKAAQMLAVGDAYINGDNIRFEVVSIQGDDVYVKNTGECKRGKEVAMVAPVLGMTGKEQGSQGAKPTIAMYCTHSDESYVPTSGVSSKEWGDVYEVMDTLEQAFESRGLGVDKSPNNHNPHDSQAYVRSRRTATQLLGKQPLVILDIHRDAVPEDEYLTEVQGTEMSAIQIVVGRQNQNREANLEFAQILKEQADKEYPGLVKGIFDAHGNYNQDLAPRSLLLEFGTHETSLEMAEKAADLISDVLLAAAGVSAPVEQAGSRSTWWIVGILVVAAIAWVLLNAVGWQGVRRFFGREFAGAMGIGRRRLEKYGGDTKLAEDQFVKPTEMGKQSRETQEDDGGDVRGKNGKNGDEG